MGYSCHSANDGRYPEFWISQQTKDGNETIHWFLLFSMTKLFEDLQPVVYSIPLVEVIEPFQSLYDYFGTGQAAPQSVAAVRLVNELGKSCVVDFVASAKKASICTVR